MKAGWWIAVSLLFAGGGFVGGMQFQKWLAGENLTRRASAAGPGTDRAAAGRELASLVVFTPKPAYVTVRVDGRVAQGRTPLTLSGLRPGRHELEVVRKGYRTFREPIELRPGERQERTITLSDELGLDYRDRLAFPGLRLEVYEDALDGRVVGMFGRIENRGPRTVHKVQLGLRFLDESGKVRHEEFVHPLLTGAGDDRPLAPKGEREFAVKLPRVPVAYCCDHVDWQVTLIDAR